jgi:hypothetical protein
MKKQQFLLVVACMACILPSWAWGQAIGLNFASEDPSAAESTLNPTDIAGFFPQSNWNNLVGTAGTESGADDGLP